MEQLPLLTITMDMVKPAEYHVTKANTLIEANYRLTLTQQRIVLLMASMVQPDDEDFKTYRIHTRDLLDILDVDRSHLYTDMIVMIRDLMKTVVTIPLPDGRRLDTHWINNQKYEVGGGYSDITFDPELKPFLLHLKEKFTTYKLENVIRLKSVYSIRIYELLKQYQGIGKRTIALEVLRKMLGIGPKEYRQYNHFKERVLIAARREINEKTDIFFEYREIKLVRRIHEIEFLITRKTVPGTPGRAAPPVSAKDRAAERRKKKIDGLIEKLSADERERLVAEATAKARQECPALYRDREVVPEPVVRGYMVEIIGEKAGGRVKEK